MIQLNKPHGFLMWRGKKTAIVRPKGDELPIGERLEVMTGDESFGFATLGHPAQMLETELDRKEYFAEHRVYRREREAWWPGETMFLVYPVEQFEARDEIKVKNEFYDWRGGEFELDDKQDSYKPPKNVQEAAARGLEWRQEYGRGGTDVGVARARDLSNGKNISLDTLKRMRSFFARHGVNRAEHYDLVDGKPTAWRIAWDLWGGDPGRRWVEGILKDKAFGSVGTDGASDTNREVKQEAEEMPYDIDERDNEVCVIKTETGEVEECYEGDDAMERAQALLAALRINVEAEEMKELTDKFLQSTRRKQESLDDRTSAVRNAFSAQTPSPIMHAESEIWVREVYDVYVIVQHMGKLFRVTYQETEAGYEFAPQSEWVEVEQIYQEKQASFDDSEWAEDEKLVGSPRNPYGTHASIGYPGGRDAWKKAWRIHFSKVRDQGPVQGTVRRVSMIAAGMKPKCNLPEMSAEDVGPRSGAAGPLSGEFNEKPSDYGLSQWKKPSEDDLTQEDVRFTCQDLEDIKRIALQEIAKRQQVREEKEIPISGNLEQSADSGLKELDAEIEQLMDDDDKQRKPIRVRKSVVQRLKEMMDGLAEIIGLAERQPQPNAMNLGDLFKDFDPTQPSGFAIKEVNGEPWMFTWSANAFIDRDKEIFSTASLERYVKDAAQKGDKGMFNFWHIPGTDYAEKAWQGVIGRFLVETGPFIDDSKGKQAAAFYNKYPKGHPEIAEEGWGCSVEYRYLPEERKTGIYENVWISRTSVLPRFAAANIQTAGGIKMALTEDQEKGLRELFPDDAEAIIAEAEAKTKELEEAGVAHKEAETPEEPEVVEEEQKEVETQEVVLDYEKLADVMVKQFNLNAAPLLEEAVTPIQETINELAARLAELEKGEEVRKEVNVTKFRLMQERASESDKTIVEDGDPLLDKKPVETRSKPKGEEFLQSFGKG